MDFFKICTFEEAHDFCLHLSLHLFSSLWTGIFGFMLYLLEFWFIAKLNPGLEEMWKLVKVFCNSQNSSDFLILFLNNNSTIQGSKSKFESIIKIEIWFRYSSFNFLCGVDENNYFHALWSKIAYCNQSHCI